MKHTPVYRCGGQQVGEGRAIYTVTPSSWTFLTWVRLHRRYADSSRRQWTPQEPGGSPIVLQMLDNDRRPCEDSVTWSSHFPLCLHIISLCVFTFYPLCQHKRFCVGQEGGGGNLENPWGGAKEGAYWRNAWRMTRYIRASPAVYLCVPVHYTCVYTVCSSKLQCP